MENKSVTLKDIAYRLNFSVSTISRALNDHHSIGVRTKTKVRKLARELNYVPNKFALFFREQKTYMIGVIVPNLGETFFSESLNAIETVSKYHNYNILIGQSHDDADLERQTAFSMKNHHVDGLIISLSKHTTNYDQLMALMNCNIPIVFFDKVPESDNVYKISANVLQNTEKAIQYLILNGHKRIAVLNGPEEMKNSKEIIKKYYEVLKSNKLTIDESLIYHTLLTKESTFMAMEELLKLENTPTAVLTFNDHVAIDAIDYARKAKLRINQDICFVSYTNLSTTKHLEFAPLASVEQYPYEQAKIAAELLFEIIASKKNVLNEKIKYQNKLVDGDLIIHKE